MSLLMTTHSLLQHQEKNHSATEPSAHVSLRSDTLKRQHNYKTHTTHNKLPSFGKEYPFFQTAGKTSHEAHCTKLRALNKVLKSILQLNYLNINVSYLVRPSKITYDHHCGIPIVK